MDDGIGPVVKRIIKSFMLEILSRKLKVVVK